MSARITIIDYGVSNLHNVCRAFEHCGANIELAADPEVIAKAERLVLPGVGAFSDGMQGLEAIDAITSIQKFAETERPFLGICLGMQMMLNSSQEFGETAGLGLLPGEVIHIPTCRTDGKAHKIPRIGWDSLLLPEGREDWSNSILDSTTPGSAVYFVHSYMAMPENDGDRLAEYDYDGVRVCAALQHNALFGCQFHPEKSGDVGLDIIRRFLSF